MTRPGTFGEGQHMSALLPMRHLQTRFITKTYNPPTCWAYAEQNAALYLGCGLWVFRCLKGVRKMGDCVAIKRHDAVDFKESSMWWKCLQPQHADCK